MLTCLLAGNSISPTLKLKNKCNGVGKIRPFMSTYTIEFGLIKSYAGLGLEECHHVGYAVTGKARLEVTGPLLRGLEARG